MQVPGNTALKLLFPLTEGGTFIAVPVAADAQLLPVAIQSLRPGVARIVRSAVVMTPVARVAAGRPGCVASASHTEALEGLFPFLEEANDVFFSITLFQLFSVFTELVLKQRLKTYYFHEILQ